MDIGHEFVGPLRGSAYYRFFAHEHQNFRTNYVGRGGGEGGRREKREFSEYGLVFPTQRFPFSRNNYFKLPNVNTQNIPILGKRSQT